MWFLVIFIYAVLVIYEFIPLYKEKQWADFWVNGVLMITSFIIALLLSLGVRIPSPMIPLGNAITSIFGK